MMDQVVCSHCKHENRTGLKYCSLCGYELPKPTATTTGSVAASSNLERRKRLIKLASSAIGFVVAYWLVQHFIFSSPSINKTMMQAASELNKNCPIMVDSYTRLDNAIALPDNIFQYNYTLISTTKDEVNIDTVRKYVEEPGINNVKTNPDMKIFRDNKTTIVYSYKDMNGVFVYKFTVTPDMYQ